MNASDPQVNDGHAGANADKTGQRGIERLVGSFVLVPTIVMPLTVMAVLVSIVMRVLNKFDLTRMVAGSMAEHQIDRHTRWTPLPST
jgi:hypothetical protein